MKKVSSISTFKTELGNMLALTYSEIDESGNIIKRNSKISKVVVDDTANEHIAKLTEFAQSIVDAVESEG